MRCLSHCTVLHACEINMYVGIAIAAAIQAAASSRLCRLSLRFPRHPTPHSPPLHGLPSMCSSGQSERSFPRMELASQLKNVGLSRRVYDALGFDYDTRSVVPGLLAEAAMPDVKAKLVEVLASHGYPLDKAKEILEMVWEECDTSSEDTLRMHGDVHTIFKELKLHGVKVAISTADTRKGTMSGLEKLDLLPYIDMIVCGDDPGIHAKPHAENALHICRALDACPTKTVVVGDTLADVLMGKNAQLGQTIGVLSGVASAEDLGEHVDHLIPNVDDILPLIRNHLKLTRF